MRMEDVLEPVSSSFFPTGMLVAFVGLIDWSGCSTLIVPGEDLDMPCVWVRSYCCNQSWQRIGESKVPSISHQLATHASIRQARWCTAVGPEPRRRFPSNVIILLSWHLLVTAQVKLPLWWDLMLWKEGKEGGVSLTNVIVRIYLRLDKRSKS